MISPQQNINYIPVGELVLWTENPREPIDKNASDQDVVDRALTDKSMRWNLSKIAKEMGAYYDFSELPTVVYHGNKPVVYDGNRRVILGKIKHKFVKVGHKLGFEIPNFPEMLPCNVCSEETALINVLRKHGESGSWQPLERDIFLHKHMKKKKTPFLILEENTKLISSQPHLNQGFVKKEIFSVEGLEEIGFKIVNDSLESVHEASEARKILSDISNKVKTKQISTRINRGQVREILDEESKKIIDQNKKKKTHHLKLAFTASGAEGAKPRQSRRIKIKDAIFGEILYLAPGTVSNLYRDIKDLYDFYKQNEKTLSKSFPSLIRMSLRMLCEEAASGFQSIDKYIEKHFDSAKGLLDKNAKTSLSVHNVNQKSLVQLLHTGAHAYKVASNIDQTIAISVILGAMLKISHPQKSK